MSDISLKAGDTITCIYSGVAQNLTLPIGTYKIKCWGAQGGGIGRTNQDSANSSYNLSSLNLGGFGGSVEGHLKLAKKTTLLLYVGGKGTDGETNQTSAAGGWNGGGTSQGGTESPAGGGGGATDIRFSSALSDRVIVAGGGGGAAAKQNVKKSEYNYIKGASGGGLKGEDGGVQVPQALGYLFEPISAKGGTQDSGGSGADVRTVSSASHLVGGSGDIGIGGDGVGGSSSSDNNKIAGGGGGAGYYGGGGGASSSMSSTSVVLGSGAGGSSFANELYFTDIVHEQGIREGDGYLEITVIDLASNVVISFKKDDTWKNSTLVMCKNGSSWYEAVKLYTKVNGSWVLCGKSSGSIGSVYSVRVSVDANIILTSDYSEQITQGETYTATVSTNSGYVIDSICVKMNGEDITESAWNATSKTISIENVSGDIDIECDSKEYVPQEYTITHNYTNVSSSHILETIEEGASYAATLTPDEGYKMSTITITMGGVDVTNQCAVSLEDGSFTTPSATGNIVITAVAVASEPMPNEIYIFDSARSDNFLFGEYRYKENTGTVNSEAVTSWPPADDEDGLNTDARKIILRSEYSGLLEPAGASPAYLVLRANGFGQMDATGKTGYFTNNVEMNGASIGSLGIPFGLYTFNINAYCTGSGYATVTYNGNAGYKITVSGTQKAKYSMTIELESNGYFDFDSVKGCGDFIITDIWLEQQATETE